jgi:type 1 glutamine amidotransferase
MSRREFVPFWIPFVLLFCLCSMFSFADDHPRKIVLIAGPITGHPKEAHEYEKNIILLKQLLDASPDLAGKIRVEAHFRGWPADPATLDDADTIFLSSDGTDREEKNHPLYTGDHFQILERQMKRGCGLVLFHWSTFNPVRVHDRITDWVGGYFDYETGAASNHWYSAIQTWNAESKPGTFGHPILRGIKPFTTREEYYYRIRFRENDPRLTPIIVTRPPKETNDFSVGWAVERANGGRGFGFTGGHFYANWWNADFRKLILNAIVWTAKLEVPSDGVRSLPFERFKALILTGHNHPAHDWRATSAALILALEQDPRAIVHVTENIEDLATSQPTPGPSQEGDRATPNVATLPSTGVAGGGSALAYNIFNYDLVVLNYCNWERPGLSDAAKSNFTRYLANDGGLAIIHFANGAWHPSLPNTKPADAWPEFYTRICRRVWEHREPNASGHEAFGLFHVEIAKVKHPITEGLQPFDAMDELYFHQAGELAVEPLAFAVPKAPRQPEPMAWAYDYGRGRVFQTVLGHAGESVRKAAALIRRGCVWAAGRNELTFDPPPELTEGALFREGSPWTPVESQRRATDVAPAGKTESANAAAAQTKRAVPSAPAIPTGSRDGLSKTTRPALIPPAGTPAFDAHEPETQRGKDRTNSSWGRTVMAQFLASTVREPDWSDARWSRTDVGQFLASTLRAPKDIVTRALSIRVGDRDEASVCFDTVNLSLRAGWTGGFLKFDPARFGLLNSPQIDGQIQFFTPDGHGWSGATGRFSGFHVHGKRVVLEYQLGETTVRESPWWEENGAVHCFTRTLEVAPSERELTLLVARLSPLRGNDPGFPRGKLQSESIAFKSRDNLFFLGLSGPNGEIERRPDGPLLLHLSASRSTRRFKLLIQQTPLDLTREFAAFVKASAAPDDLSRLQVPGPARWLPALETTGRVEPDTGPLAIDTLTVPYDNPWNALMFLAGVDFTSDGTAYVCSIHGDVWKVSGIDDQVQNVSWKRFATGLYQPLGLKVIHDQVHVLGRDQITRLRDENGDGEADAYENFCNLIQTSPNPHQYVTSLETDSRGSCYYVDPVGVHRVSEDGRSMETLASGFRNPNGLGVSPEGSIITVAPQQGEWTPSSAIVEIKRGGYYGYGGPKVTPDRPLGYDPVLCWIPHTVDNSGGSQVWVPQRRAGVPPALAQPKPGADLNPSPNAAGDWGPLAGQMLHFSWGRCSMMLVLRDDVDGVAQGATVALPGRFLSGAMRGAFNPRDGHLYVVGSTGWQTSALKEGCFQRVRYTGRPLDVPVAWHARRDGLTFTFAQPLEKDTAEDAGSYGVEQWNYRYASQYGSKDWSVARPAQAGRDKVEVRSARLMTDGRTVLLEIPDLKPVMQLQVQYNLNAKEGASVRGKVYATINRVPLATSAEQH